MSSAGNAANTNSQGNAARQIVDEYERLEVSDHPFFKDMQHKPVDYAALWLLMANLQCSISDQFVRWLAGIIERVDDRRIASLLAKQLNDELGNGDFAEIHAVMLERFVAGLAPWRPAGDPEALLAPGRSLLSEMSRIFGASDPYDGVGALMVSEIFAKKMDKCVGDQLRRQSALSRETMTWLDLHEQLEIEHAEDSYELAELVPDRGPQLPAAWRGARAEWDALWTFLDDVYAANQALQATG